MLAKKPLIFFSLIYLFCSTAIANPIRQIVFFGDSLTDNGNLHRALFKMIPKDPPYVKGRFANGPVWSDEISEYFQTKYHVSSQNYAVGGTTVVLRNPFKGSFPYTISQEITHYLFLTLFQDRSQTLFVIWAGANDYTVGAKNVEAATQEVIHKMVEDIKRLIASGAKQFFIINLPDLAKTPFAKTVPYSETLHTLSITHNQKLTQAIALLQKEARDVQFITLNIYDTLDDLYTHPEKYNKKYNQHFTNFKDPCWEGGYTLAQDKNAKTSLKAELQTVFPSPTAEELAQHITSSPSLSEAYQVSQRYQKGHTACKNPQEYIFWDKLHPTTHLHHVAAQIAIESLEKKILLQQ